MYDLGPYSISAVVVAGVLWSAAAIAVHLQLEERRPHY
jgi:hypothetical protein